ncbi:MAG TPA: hypothetical protein VGH37_01780 [Candidatus Acidoferrum sp.]|jgi:hypothetical protein
MRGKKLLFSRWVVLFVVLLLATGISLGQTSTKVQVSQYGIGSLTSAPPGIDGMGNPEVDPALAGDDDSDIPLSGGKMVNRSIATHIGSGPAVRGNGKAKSNPELTLSFNGLNFRDQRLANGGNQFSVEPPDQGLCAGNGYVLETVNDVLRVFDANGNPLTGVIDLNSFYGYPAAINRSTGAYGPEITDPSCYFDQATQRWFHIVLTLDRVGTSSALSGANHIDIAVTTTPSPLGPWIIYHLPVQNDGTDGTPNHGCAGGPCLGDYPHIGADSNGIFITTNEFAVFGPGFYGAQIYGLSKQALASGAPSVTAVLFNTGDPSIPFPGFTVWAAISSDGVYDGSHGGTEMFLSSLAVFSNDGTSNQILLWNVSNTSSLNSPNPSLSLSGQYINVATYGVPPRSDQKAGDYPLGQCLSDNSIATPFGAGCWRYFFSAGGPFANTEKQIDSNDSRMQQVYFANGKLWSALDTAVTVGGATKAGVAYYVLNPHSGHLFQQGFVAVENNNLSYPAIAVNGSGRGVMAFTLVGADHYPTAAYTSMDAKIGAGDVHVIAEGIGPDDGFTGYHPYSAYGSRPRWGDYGGAVSDGSYLWIASEDIGQTCTLSEYLATGFSCGNTRTSLGNWNTRISQLVP